MSIGLGVVGEHQVNCNGAHAWHDEPTAGREGSQRMGLERGEAHVAAGAEGIAASGEGQGQSYLQN